MTAPTRRAVTGIAADPPAMRALGVAIVLSLLLWQAPYGYYALYPFKILATWMHELSHGVMMLISGAGFDRMEIYPDTSGLSFAAGQTERLQRVLIAPAGYMGTPLFGALMLAVGQTARGARWALAGLGAATGLCALLVVSNDFGREALAITGAGLCALALASPARWAIFAANLFAAQACINAVLDIRVLFRPQMVVDGRSAGGSDAHTMAAATFGTDARWAVWVWAAAWLLWSLALLYAAIRWIRRRTRA
jgi:Peptidase M50B-like